MRVAAMTAPHIFADDIADQQARRNVEALADGLGRVLGVALALLRGGNQLDLTGLDGLFGLLCARTLDLEPDHARLLQPRLHALRNELDALLASVAPGGLN